MHVIWHASLIYALARDAFVFEKLDDSTETVHVGEMVGEIGIRNREVETQAFWGAMAIKLRFESASPNALPIDNTEEIYIRGKMPSTYICPL